MIIRFALLKIGEVLGLWVLYVMGCLVGEFIIVSTLGGSFKNAFEAYVLSPFLGVYIFGTIWVLVTITYDNMRLPTREECFVLALCIATVCIYCNVGQYVDFWTPIFAGLLSGLITFIAICATAFVVCGIYVGAEAFVKSNIKLARRIK